MNKDIIIRLLLEDINHNKLLNGLQSIGLTDNEQYTSNMPYIVAEMMDVEPSDKWLNTYHQTMMDISNSITPKEALSAAKTLLEGLYVTE